MTLPFLDFWCCGRLNYTKKEGGHCFLFAKSLKPLINLNLKSIKSKID